MGEKSSIFFSPIARFMTDSSTTKDGLIRENVANFSNRFYMT
jgi:hypothetical protein